MADFDKWIKKYRTQFSAIAALVFLFLARPDPNSLLLGLIFIIPGEAIRIWSAGCIHKSRLLSMTGPYSISRNPLYIGSFLMGFGFMISIGVIWLMAVFLVFYAYIYWFTIRWEEKKLKRKFPGQWEDYASKVPRFISPAFFTSYTPGDFSWFQVSRNKELWNALAVLAVYGILWGKYLLSGIR